MIKAVSSLRGRLLLGVVLLIAAALGAYFYFNDLQAWPRGEALGIALAPVIDKGGDERALVARVIWLNYLELRHVAANWSGVFWGFSFAAAGMSALAALVLKLETLIENERLKKDLAAICSIVAALLVTISTSGDFQRKWQANRIAAAELERLGYEFLETDGAHARSYLASVGQILLRKNVAIAGNSDARAAAAQKERSESPGK